MANQYAMLASGGGVSFSSSTTYFQNFNAPQWSNTTEINAQVKFRGASTLDQMNVNVVTASSSATTVDVRQNGSSSAVTVSCTGGATGVFSDATHSVTVADGDKMGYRVAVGTGGGFVANVSARLSMAAQIGPMLTATTLTSTAPASTAFWGVAGGSATIVVTTEVEQQIVAMESATLSHLQLNLSSNNTSGSHGIISRKNGTAGAQTVSVTASTSGLYEDVTNADTLAPGDLYSAQGF